MNSQGNKLKELIEFFEAISDSYIEATLPCPVDNRILVIISRVIDSTSADRKEIYRAISAPASDSLHAFAERMSMLSVRKQNSDFLLRGLVAITMAKEVDDREVAMRLTLLYRSAQLLGLDADAFFKQSTDYMQRISPSTKYINSFLRRKSRLQGIEGMGYREIDGPSGLVYVAGYLGDVPAGLLYEDEPLVSNELEAFFSNVERRSWYAPRATLYLDLRNNIEIPTQIEEKLNELLQNGSRDTRVALALGGLGVKDAADKLKTYLTSETGEFLLSFKIGVALALWWIDQSPDALQFMVEAADQGPDLGMANQIAIALQYFKCGQAVRTLREMLNQDISFNSKYYAAGSLLVLCDPDEKIGKKALSTRMNSRDAKIRQEFFEDLDNLIEQNALSDC